jgi:hypothetical protein
MSISAIPPFARLVVFSVLLAGLLLGCATGPKTAKTLSDPDAQRLKPGLSVRYYDGFVRHVREIPEDEILLKISRPGKPVTKIDHQFGGGEIFDSGKSRGVGMRMEGYLRMQPAGTYQFKALTNDGFSMHIGDARVLYDPDVHGDRWTEPTAFVAEEAGWHPVQLRYFQRKGTAALRLHWQPPGAEEFVPVPAEALGHIP